MACGNPQAAFQTYFTFNKNCQLHFLCIHSNYQKSQSKTIELHLTWRQEGAGAKIVLVLGKKLTLDINRNEEFLQKSQHIENFFSLKHKIQVTLK